MEIDLVYNYVNGSDEAWLEKRSRYEKNSTNSVCRFRDNHELMFSLRSVEKYAPWIHHIYILMDSRVPEWLNTDNSRITVVDHSEFMPQELLPCYNSNVIESFLDRIPGLSEVFLYACDDMFFGNQVTEDFFFKDGKPLVRMYEHRIQPKGYWYTALYRSQQMILSHYGIRMNLVPSHNIDVYTKSALAACRAEYAEEFAAASKNRLRAEGDIQRVIFHYYMIANDLCTLKTYKGYRNTRWNRYRRIGRDMLFASKYLDLQFCMIERFFQSKKERLYFLRGPKLVCLNDSNGTSEEDLEKYGKLMMKKFPRKSSFER